MSELGLTARAVPSPFAARPAEPAVPSVSASTLEWFAYYRQMIAFQAQELPRLRYIEAAALRVASSRRNRVVTDQAVLDVLDQALERQA